MRGLLFIVLFSAANLSAQDDLLSLLGEEEVTEYVNASFKTNRVINLHSLESTAEGVLDFKISHRFGLVSGGISELFGIDQASIRFGFDYGVSDRLTIGLGRSGFEKTYDGFIKYKMLRQKKGSENFPFTLAFLGTSAIKTTPFQDPDRDNLFSSRLYHTGQMIIGSKVSDGFSFQISPTIVHRNLVKENSVANDVFALGTAGRIKLSKRVAINAEYIYVMADQLAPGFRNSLSLGFDIETGGHVFQLHFTNSTSIIEKGFIAENTGSWTDGDVHFGFNVSRVFTVKSGH